MEDVGFRHQALIYEGADEYLAGTVPFLWAALEAEEPALVAARPCRAELLEGELGGDARWVQFVSIEEIGPNPAAIIPLWRSFLDGNGGGPARGIAEPVWADRSPAALEERSRHEALLNVAFAEHPGFALLCPYDAGAAPAEALERVGLTHPRVGCCGIVTESAEFDPALDCFAGELPPPAVAPETVSFGIGELPEVRRRVAAAAGRAGMDPLGTADFVTATSELAANSVVHGGGTGTLRLWREGGNLLAEVEDRGRIEEPLVGRLRPDVTQEGGRGLWLANKLCDLVQIRSGERGTVVRLQMPAQTRALV